MDLDAPQIYHDCDHNEAIIVDEWMKTLFHSFKINVLRNYIVVFISSQG